MDKSKKSINLLLIINILLAFIVIIIASIPLLNEELLFRTVLKINGINMVFVMGFIFSCLKMFEYQKCKSKLRESVLNWSLIFIFLVSGCIFLLS